MKNNAAGQSPADILTSHVTGAVAKKKGAMGAGTLEASTSLESGNHEKGDRHNRGNKPRVTNFSSITPNLSAGVPPPPKRKLQFESNQHNLGGNNITKSTPNLRGDESLKVVSPFQSKRHV